MAQGTTPERPYGLSAFAPLFLDVFAPLAVYAAMSLLTDNDFIRLGAAAVLPALYVVASALRGRPIDRAAILVLALLALSIALTWVTGDPRILLAKSVIITGAVGLYFLATLLFAERPFIFYASQKTFAAREPDGEAQWEKRWLTSPAFRRAMRLLTVIWGAGLVGEGAVRAVIIFTFPITQALIWGHVWGIGCLVAFCLITLRISRRTREIVRAELRSQAR